MDQSILIQNEAQQLDLWFEVKCERIIVLTYSINITFRTFNSKQKSKCGYLLTELYHGGFGVTL